LGDSFGFGSEGGAAEALGLLDATGTGTGVGATVVGGGAIGVGGALPGELSTIMGFIDTEAPGPTVSSSADVGAGDGAFGFGADVTGVGAGAGAGFLGVFDAGVSGNILRTTEFTPCAVSDSGGGGGGIGTGGDWAPAEVVDEAASGLAEVEVVLEEVFEVELVEFAAAAVGAVPPCLFTLVQRRPRKVVMLDSIQPAVEYACGAEE
jgi:hypothetical protein